MTTQKITERMNAFAAAITDAAAAQRDNAEADRIMNEQLEDEAVALRVKTQLKRAEAIEKFNELSAEALKKALQLCSESAIVDTYNDFKSATKATQLFEAIAHTDRSRLRDNKLISFLAQFATAEEQQRYSAFEVACDSSQRQTQMCMKLLQRLTLRKFDYSRSRNVVSIDESNKLVKAIRALYE